jgi:hypothetical protein
MDMGKFIGEIHHASNVVLSSVWHERNRIEKLKAEIKRLEPAVRIGYQQSDALYLNAETPDDVMMAAGRHWETYFGADKDLHLKNTELDDFKQKLLLHQFSIDALSGSLLQYAKQGISIVHGGLSKCPPGRLIGSQPLRDIIWQSRNQAIHWEDGKLHPPVEACFKILAKDIDQKFNQYNNSSMAFNIVEALGWRTFADFEKDMLSLK